jgi:hypothetical protein
MPMQSSADPTPILRGEVPLDHVFSQPIQPLVAKVVMPMQSPADPTPLLGGEVPLNHVVSQPIQPWVARMIILMQPLADPTPLLRGEVPLDLVVSQPMQPLVEKVVTLMQSSIDPTPLLRGEVPLDLLVSQPMQPLVEKVVSLMQSSVDPIPLLRGEVPLDIVVSQPMQSLVEKVVMLMQSSADPTPLLRGEVPLDHVVSQPMQSLVKKVVTSSRYLVDPTLFLESVESTKVVTSLQSSVDPTLLLESVESTKVVTLLQSLVDPTLLLKSVESTKVVTQMPSLVDPTPLLGSEMSTDYVFNISSFILSEQGGILLALSTPPPSPRMVSFDWNDLVEPCLPSSAPFQIRVEVNSTNIYRCIVHEGASASILSSSVWKVLGSPKLVSTSHELLDFERCPSEYLGVLPQLTISLGGNIVHVDVIVVQGPLDFNMLLGRDYVYAMNVMVSTLFRVMHFPHNGSIVTIDQLAYDNHHSNLVLVQDAPLYVPSVRVDSTPTWVNYMASYPRCSISSEQEPVQSCFPSRDLESTIDPLVHPMGAWEPLLPPLGPSGLECPSESDLVVCRSSSPCACDSSPIDSASTGQNLHHHMEYG